VQRDVDHGWSPAPTWIALRTKRFETFAPGLQCRNAGLRGGSGVFAACIETFKFGRLWRFLVIVTRAPATGELMDLPHKAGAVRELLERKQKGIAATQIAELASGMHFMV